MSTQMLRVCVRLLLGLCKSRLQTQIHTTVTTRVCNRARAHTCMHVRTYNVPTAKDNFVIYPDINRFIRYMAFYIYNCVVF